YAAIIASNWEKVIAEAAFKYAGAVHGDIDKLKSGENPEKALRYYAKHWGELKGFAMALQTGKQDLGDTATAINDLIGFGPAMPDGKMVSGIDAEGHFLRDQDMTLEAYQANMIALQQLLLERFDLKSRAYDLTEELAKAP
ncbi:MAG: DUF4856 domain-containing protein, partial [Mangrovicoccus sp.]|nr:DUF4856 domain-containing protein [Mangrovicoccus sp.]